MESRGSVRPCPHLSGTEHLSHPLPGQPYLIGIIEQGDMEGDEPWEACIREGEALHEEALLIAVQAGYLIGHPVRAQNTLIGLTGILGAYGKRSGHDFWAAQRVEQPHPGPRQTALPLLPPATKQRRHRPVGGGEGHKVMFALSQLVASTHLFYKNMQTGTGEAVWQLRVLAVLAPLHRGSKVHNYV